MSTAVIGTSSDRVDGHRKVTGGAHYAADYALENLAYGVPVLSTTGKGRIVSIDASAARQAPGFIAIITRENSPKLKAPANDFGSWTKLGEARILFADDEIHYVGQYLALVVGETLEQAIAAAALVSVKTVDQAPATSMDGAMDAAYKPKGDDFGPVEYKRGDVSQQTGVAFTVEGSYVTPIEHHNPMEPSATIARWDDEKLTLYDATQWVMGARNCMADMFGIPREDVHIISEFVGGGFGCKGFVWPHQALAAVAAKIVSRPVKIALSRPMMFTGCGHRPETRQKITLAADAQGKLLSLKQEVLSETSPVDEYTEKCGVATPHLYACPNVQVTQRLVPVNIATPTPMRAPGESPGLFAIESALDELAFNMKLDPVELRLRNYAAQDPARKLPYSSKYLRECYAQGVERMGWADRSAKPGTTRDGRYWVGYGMATATYPGYRMEGAALVRLHANGRASVASATQDIGGGTYTTMAQVAAETLGLPLGMIDPALGDSRLPPAPVSGGSMTTASVTPAVKLASEDAIKKIVQLAQETKGSVLFNQKARAANGRVSSFDGAISMTFADVLKAAGLEMIQGDARAKPGKEQGQYSFHSFGAQFVKVRVDPDLGRVHVMRIVSVFDVGRVINPKTARSQALGGIIQGIGMALMEQTHYDHRNGAPVTASLADYLVPVNADIQSIEPTFLNIPDPYISSMGARGIGEIAITGVAPAIANAVFNATGKRVRELPITIERLLD